MDKYQSLREAKTNGANFDLNTDAIIAHLKEWDAMYGIEVSEAAPDAVTVVFRNVPADPTDLATDIDKFCPDVIGQNLGCVREMLDAAEELGQPVPPHITGLIEGVDLNEDGYGLELLKRMLLKERKRFLCGGIEGSGDA